MTDLRSQLDDLLPRCMLSDRARIERALRGGRGRGRSRQRGRPPSLESLIERARASAALRDRRNERRPQPRFANDLPINQRRDEIAAAIESHRAVVICGETGSGKSTQLPQICLDLGRGVGGLIGHTQPRRIAARSVAARVAEELGVSLGRDVGFKMRFTDTVSDDTYVKVMTDGILLAETQGDRNLTQYDTIIIDEAHERSLNIDFLLGYLKQLLRRRADLKVIVTSATIDPERFSQHFDGAPIIEVSGRTYPVEIRYRPMTDDETSDDDPSSRDIIDAVVDGVRELQREGPGDILVFLSGEREIREAAEAVTRRGGLGPRDEVLPLFARLSGADQQRVFQPHGGRRIILATNVAETSITVPGVKYVIDPGLARISRYSAASQVQRLPIERISQASAQQRSGRCGRVSDGICLRLYSETDFASREEFTPAEVLRTDLASVILRMKALRLGEPSDFPFVEPPTRRFIRDGYETLRELGAIDEQDRLTEIGRRLARLPIDPRLGRMLVAAGEENALREVLAITAVLAIQDPRERPHEKAGAADAAHAEFDHEDSDFLSLLNIWNFYRAQSKKLSRSKLARACKQNFLSPIRMREWVETYVQLRDLCHEGGVKMNPSPAAYDAVHRALLAGLLTRVGRRGERHVYHAPRDTQFYIFPGSGQFDAKPKWIMATEIVETTRSYGRTIAKLRPEWIERVAGDLLKKSWRDPHWSPDAGAPLAYEKATLFGLEIYDGRRIPFGAIDPKGAREMFIHHALVEGDCAVDAPFMTHNRQLVEDVRELEAKHRRRDLLADVQARFAFYDRLIPADVHRVSDFEKWRKARERGDARVLFMTEADVFADGASVGAEDFPDHLDTPAGPLPLEYHLDPGGERDGVTILAPIEHLDRLQPDALDWLTPGMRAEKVAALVRTLPKNVRRTLGPIPQLAADIAHAMDPRRTPRFLDALGDAVRRVRGVDIPPDWWRPDDIDDHLRMNIRILDADDQVAAEGRDLAAVREELGAAGRPTFIDAPDAAWQRDDVRDWDFGPMPETFELSIGARTATTYPALVRLENGRVGLRLLDAPDRAAARHREGVTLLLMDALHDELAGQTEQLPDLGWMRLQYAPVAGDVDLAWGVHRIAVALHFVAGQPPIRDADAFRRRLRERASGLWGRTLDVCETLRTVLDLRHGVDGRLSENAPDAWRGAFADLRGQLDALLPAGFLSDIDSGWFMHTPRYLQAMDRRIARLPGGGHVRDAKLFARIAPRLQAFAERAASHARQHLDDPQLGYHRWLLEELRVATFAQDLGVAVPVSDRDLDEHWARVRH